MLIPQRLAIAATAVAAAAALPTGCGLAATRPATKTAAVPAAAPTPLRGEAARIADVVTGLGRALRDGEVERLCRPRAIFTDAVVAEMGSGGMSCEASVEDLLAERRVPAMRVVAVAVQPGLATAHVRVGRSRTVPLTLVRDRRRWLISFSDGNDPLGALTE